MMVMCEIVNIRVLIEDSTNSAGRWICQQQLVVLTVIIFMKHAYL
jgi:hypothetical protein